MISFHWNTGAELTLPGPAIASKELIPNPGKLQIQGSKNEEVVQESGIE
jgi:hypothetical protein